MDVYTVEVNDYDTSVEAVCDSPQAVVEYLNRIRPEGVPWIPRAVGDDDDAWLYLSTTVNPGYYICKYRVVTT